jgi:hypothetical protein
MRVSRRHLLLISLGLLIGAVGLWVLSQTVLPELTASYVRYNSADEVANRAFVGDRVVVPLAPSFSSVDWTYEKGANGLIVKAPEGGLRTGQHLYYLQIVSFEDRPDPHSRAGTAAPTVRYLIATVKKIE